MPPQNFNVPNVPDRPNSLHGNNQGKPLWLKIVLALMIAFVVFTAAIYTFNHYIKPSLGGTWNETESKILPKFKTYTNRQYGFEVNYPSDFVFQENPDGAALVGFWYSQSAVESPVGGIGTKIYVEHSNFSSFEDFATDMEENYIFEHVKANDRSLSDQQAREEVKKYEGRYSFVRRKINNIDVLIHNRDFFGYIDGASEAYFWIGNGDYLLIYGSGLDLNSFKFINTPQN